MVFIVYCLETVIIGLVNILKMAAVTLFVRSKHEWQNKGSVTMQSGWFFIFFFIVHYGLFVFVQTQIFFAASGINDEAIGFAIYKKIPALLGNEGKILLLIFITYYTVQSFSQFFYTGQYKQIPMMWLMFQPYMRIFVQQLIVIFGSIFLSFGGGGKIFILIVVLTKLFAEIYLNMGRILDRTEKKGWVDEAKE